MRAVMLMTHNPLPAHLASQAEFIVNTLKHTDYQSVADIHAEKGIYDCDCNGFVGFVLENAAPAHYALIPKEADQFRPRAFEYHDFFASLPAESSGGWHRIVQLSDARRGDILAWRFPEIEWGKHTGHVLFLAQTPSIDDAGNFRVRVYDSADQAHFEDTRATGEFPTGVGSGLIYFQVDAAGEPTAFLFAPGKMYTTLPTAIGRAEPL
jgi:hypothetical protein